MADPLTSDAIRQIQNDYFMQFILDNSKVLDELHHKLKGEILIEVEREINGQKVLIPEWQNKWGLKPIMNNKGINFIMNSLNLSLSVTNATGNIDDTQVAMLSQVAYQNIITVFRLKLVEFEFEDEATMCALADQLMTLIFIHLSKSREGSFLKQMSTSYQYSEIRDGKVDKPQKESNINL